MSWVKSFLNRLHCKASKGKGRHNEEAVPSSHSPHSTLGGLRQKLGLGSDCEKGADSRTTSMKDSFLSGHPVSGCESDQDATRLSEMPPDLINGQDGHYSATQDYPQPDTACIRPCNVPPHPSVLSTHESPQPDTAFLRSCNGPLRPSMLSTHNVPQPDTAFIRPCNGPLHPSTLSTHDSPVMFLRCASDADECLSSGRNMVTITDSIDDAYTLGELMASGRFLDVSGSGNATANGPHWTSPLTSRTTPKAASNPVTPSSPPSSMSARPPSSTPFLPPSCATAHHMRHVRDDDSAKVISAREDCALQLTQPTSVQASSATGVQASLATGVQASSATGVHASSAIELGARSAASGKGGLATSPKAGYPLQAGLASKNLKASYPAGLINERCHSVHGAHYERNKHGTSNWQCEDVACNDWGRHRVSDEQCEDGACDDLPPAVLSTLERSRSPVPSMARSPQQGASMQHVPERVSEAHDAGVGSDTLRIAKSNNASDAPITAQGSCILSVTSDNDQSPEDRAGAGLSPSLSTTMGIDLGDLPPGVVPGTPLYDMIVKGMSNPNPDVGGDAPCGQKFKSLADLQGLFPAGLGSSARMPTSHGAAAWGVDHQPRSLSVYDAQHSALGGYGTTSKTLSSLDATGRGGEAPVCHPHLSMSSLYTPTSARGQGGPQHCHIGTKADGAITPKRPPRSTPSSDPPPSTIEFSFPSISQGAQLMRAINQSISYDATLGRQVGAGMPHLQAMGMGDNSPFSSQVAQLHRAVEDSALGSLAAEALDGTRAHSFLTRAQIQGEGAGARMSRMDIIQMASGSGTPLRSVTNQEPGNYRGGAGLSLSRSNTGVCRSSRLTTSVGEGPGSMAGRGADAPHLPKAKSMLDLHTMAEPAAKGAGTPFRTSTSHEPRTDKGGAPPSLSRSNSVVGDLPPGVVPGTPLYDMITKGMATPSPGAEEELNKEGNKTSTLCSSRFPRTMWALKLRQKAEESMSQQQSGNGGAGQHMSSSARLQAARHARMSHELHGRQSMLHHHHQHRGNIAPLPNLQQVGHSAPFSKLQQRVSATHLTNPQQVENSAPLNKLQQSLSNTHISKLQQGGSSDSFFKLQQPVNTGHLSNQQQVGTLAPLSKLQQRVSANHISNLQQGGSTDSLFKLQQ